MSPDRDRSFSETMALEVELLGDQDSQLEPPPGRVLLVHPKHTLWDLAIGIDDVFGRWEREDYTTEWHFWTNPGNTDGPGRWTMSAGNIPGRDRYSRTMDNFVHCDIDQTEPTQLVSTYLEVAGDDFSFESGAFPSWVHRCRAHRLSRRMLSDWWTRERELYDGPPAYIGWGSIPDAEHHANATAVDHSTSGPDDAESKAAGEHWLIRVALVHMEDAASRPVTLQSPPVRKLIAHPRHTLDGLAKSIFKSFCRMGWWDIHAFFRGHVDSSAPLTRELADGAGGPLTTPISRCLPSEFTFVWERTEFYHCTVERKDLRSQRRQRPSGDVGWGSVPDQHGHRDRTDVLEDLQSLGVS